MSAQNIIRYRCCKVCGLGFGEFMACELPDCQLETEEETRARIEPPQPIGDAQPTHLRINPMPTEAEVMELAERIATMGDITCPFCGEEGFDIPGFVFSHENWCEVIRACCAVAAKNNAEVAAALRATLQDRGDDNG